MRERCNLMFFCTDEKQAEDFREVARRIRERAPDVCPYIFVGRSSVRPLLSSAVVIHRPTVSIEMGRRRHGPRILRGVRLMHGGIAGKVEQYRRLDALGLPVPKWTEIVPDTRLDPKEWGPYVVVKPSEGFNGAFVWIHKTGRVRFKERSDYPEDHPGRRGPMIAQQFIYTGPWPVVYRVLTYFGRAIAAIRYDGRRDMPPLKTAFGFGELGGRSIVGAAKGCRISLAADDDVIDLACRAYAAAPEIPSLGVDIIRDERSGGLYIAEIGPDGVSWMLTNDRGLEIQAEFGLDFHCQFAPLDVIADRSIEIAREYAR